MTPERSPEDIAANARLIAAVPDLLAVCKAINASDAAMSPLLWADLRAAIAKATGAA